MIETQEKICYRVEIMNTISNSLIKKNQARNITSRRRLAVVINKNPENDCMFRRTEAVTTAPGNKMYSKAASTNLRNNEGSKRIYIISDSIPKILKMKEFNRLSSSGKTYIRAFPGATARQLNHYVQPTLVDDKPDAILIHEGINDLLNNNGKKLIDVEIEELAQEIIDIGLRCKETKVKNILISGITYSTKLDVNTIRRLNDIVKVSCELNSFYYINNENVKKEHLWKDDIHLVNSGLVIIANNFIYGIQALQDLNIT